MESIVDYPICDTDMWIKVSKANKNGHLIKQYKKLVFSEVCISEINHLSEKDKREFGRSLEEFNKFREEIIGLYLQGEFFDDRTRLYIKRIFEDEKIPYDFVNNKFQFKSNLGEKVSIIYAYVLKLKIILSDDNGCKEFLKNYPKVQIIKFREILKKLNVKDFEESLLLGNSTKNTEEAIKLYLNTSKITDTNELCNILHYKEKLFQKPINYEYYRRTTNN